MRMPSAAALLAGTTRLEITHVDMMQPGGVAGDGTAARDARLRELAHGALRRATLAARFEESVNAEVRGLIREVCDVAHERGLLVEQLLVLLKDAWWELPEKRRLPRQDASAVLARAITVCIHEYYARGDGLRS